MTSCQQVRGQCPRSLSRRERGAPRLLSLALTFINKSCDMLSGESRRLQKVCTAEGMDRGVAGG